MTSDTLLTACALIELVQRQDGNTCDLDDALALLSETCPHAETSLYLAGALVNICKEVSFDLGAFVDHERSEALSEGGMA